MIGISQGWCRLTGLGTNTKILPASITQGEPTPIGRGAIGHIRAADMEYSSILTIQDCVKTIWQYSTKKYIILFSSHGYVLAHGYLAEVLQVQRTEEILNSDLPKNRIS